MNRAGIFDATCIDIGTLCGRAPQKNSTRNRDIGWSGIKDL